MISLNLLVNTVLILNRLHLVLSPIFINLNSLQSVDVICFLSPHEVDPSEGPFAQQLQDFKVYG